LASRADKFTAGKFSRPANAKDSFAISDCRDDRHKWVLEFLIPILYLEKPTWVTATVGNTIFGAMEGRFVHWEKIIGGVVAKLVGNLGKAKMTLS